MFELQKLLHQLAREFLKRIVYGSVIGAVVVFLLVHSSGWKAADAAFTHADYAVAAWVSDVTTRLQLTSHKSDVITLAVTDKGYADLFKSTSPLDRSVLVQIIDHLLTGTSTTSAVIVIDLDLSPASGSTSRQKIEQERLDKLLIANKNRIVIPLPPSAVTDSRIADWVKQLCTEGVLFGRSEMVQTFGLINFGRDVQESLSSVAIAASKKGMRQDQIVSACQSRQTPTIALDQHGSSPQEIASPMTLPIDGDSTVNEDALRQMGAHFVVLGGTWGIEDRFKTPFGERFGVNFHAAKLQGYVQHSTAAPFFFQVLLAFIVAAIVNVSAATFAGYLSRSMARPNFKWAIQPLNSKQVRLVHFLEYQLPGQRFRRGVGSRFLVLIFVISLICLVVLALAVANGVMGLYFPTLIVVGACVFNLLDDWGSITVGLQFDSRFATGARNTLRGQFFNPVVEATKSLQLASRVALSGRIPTENKSQLLFGNYLADWSKQTGQVPRQAAISEIFFVLVSLFTRTVAPAVSFFYLLSQ